MYESLMYQSQSKYPNGTTPKVDMAHEGVMWLEWAAALYESHMADWECSETWRLMYEGDATEYDFTRASGYWVAAETALHDAENAAYAVIEEEMGHA